MNEEDLNKKWELLLDELYQDPVMNIELIQELNKISLQLAALQTYRK